MKLLVWVGLVLCLVGTAEAKSAKIVATVSKFNQVADIPPTLVYAPRRPGFYRVEASSSCGQVQVQAIPGPSRLRVEAPGYVRVGDGIFYTFDSLGQGPCDIGIAVEDVFDVSSIPAPVTTTTTTSTSTTTTTHPLTENTTFTFDPSCPQYTEARNYAWVKRGTAIHLRGSAPGPVYKRGFDAPLVDVEVHLPLDVVADSSGMVQAYPLKPNGFPCDYFVVTVVP